MVCTNSLLNRTMATTIEQQVTLDEALVPRTKRDDILFSTIKVAYKEYYACDTGEAEPKLKASARRKRGGSYSSTTLPTAIASPRPITIVAAAPRLTATSKGKQPARATSPTDPLEIEKTEAEQLKIDDDNDEEEIAKLDEQEDTESGEGDAEETKSDEESVEEETREEEEESFDPIPRTSEESADDGNSEEDQGLRVSEEQRLIEEEEADELYRDARSPFLRLLHLQSYSNIHTYNDSFHHSHNNNIKVKSLEVKFSEFMQTNQFAEAISKISDKTILESYGDTTILKRRREDDDDQEGPSAGSDRGSKRRREGGEPESASSPFEPATRSASRSTTGTQSRQMSASESAFA
nr:hypothetical protein [Tanacetum cinerariifolium]